MHGWYDFAKVLPCQYFVLYGKCYLYVGPPKSPTIKVENIKLDSFTISWTVITDVNNACGPVSYRVTRLSGPHDHVIDFTSMTNITYNGLRRHTTNYTVVVVRTIQQSWTRHSCYHHCDHIRLEHVNTTLWATALGAYSLGLCV